jgi:Na+-transporting NADH:ubiquinone oxidoreductase subunit A
LENGKVYKLKKGYDINISDESSRDIIKADYPGKVAVKPVDFTGLKPKPEVQVGDHVKAGDSLAHHKYHPAIKLTAPLSGEVVEIKRGYRRAIERIVIQTDEQNVSREFEISGTSDRGKILETLMKSGLFLYLKQRPFNSIPDPDIIPRDIFISGMNTYPMAPDIDLLLQGNEKYFQQGLSFLSQLTSGKVHLSTMPDEKFLFENFSNVEIHLFDGPHPAGNVGVQIHHIAPIINREDVVWTCHVQGVIQIGKFFTLGHPEVNTLVKVSGPAAKNRQYYNTKIGAAVSTFARGDKNARWISGDVLTGRGINPDGFLGFFDNLISIIPEADKVEFLGWISPGLSKLSMSRSFLSTYNPFKKAFELNTKVHGSKRAFVASTLYEKVLPMDILPVFLMKAVIIEDFEEMEQLGIYELAEEDVALCEYVCPSKIEWQTILRRGLDQVEKEG